MADEEKTKLAEVLAAIMPQTMVTLEEQAAKLAAAESTKAAMTKAMSEMKQKADTPEPAKESETPEPRLAHKFISLSIQSLTIGDFRFENYRFETEDDEKAQKLVDLLSNLDGPTKSNVHYLGILPVEAEEQIRRMDAELNKGKTQGAVAAPGLRAPINKIGSLGPMTSATLSDMNAGNKS